MGTVKPEVGQVVLEGHGAAPSSCGQENQGIPLQAPSKSSVSRKATGLPEASRF